MYFKKLELVGFKSFFSKTTLNFEPGITAVVGPNGCGKSNVFDSIRWVLGEQSVKALRGSEMQDVIFNGSDTKESLSMAEVSLTFDNSVRFFNIDQEEIVISRRIFRSGESEYLLNKSLVRLKDILDLLMGTGIGAESYSLVPQGKIDFILSSRPEDRRQLLDEAAGITKYKFQKKEAMRKLEETEQNLLRVNDIITEVKRQIGSLERQANKARKYKETFGELKLKEINLALLQKRNLLQQRDEIIEQLTKTQAQESEFLKAILEQESLLGNRQAELKSLEENIMAIKNEILNLENLAVINKQQSSFNQEKIKELDAAWQYLQSQGQQTKSRIIMDEEKLNELKQEYNGINNNIEERQKLLEEKDEELNALNSAIKASLDNIAKAKREILDLVSKIAGSNNEIADFTAKQQIYLARKKRLELEKAKVSEERNSIGGSLKIITQELESLNKVSEDINSKITNAKNDLAQETSLLNSIESDIEKLEREKLTQESHREFIEKLKTKYEDLGECMNVILYLDKLPREKLTGLVVKIKDFQETSLKSFGEAKPIDLDTQKISQRIEAIKERIDSLRKAETLKKARTEELNKLIQQLEQELRSQELILANKKSSHETALEQFNKLKEEEEIITLELVDVEKELAVLEEKLAGLKNSQAELEKGHKQKEDMIAEEQNNIASKSNLKEQVVVTIAQAKTEIDGFKKRISQDEATLKILEDTHRQDKDNLSNIEKQIQENQSKKESLLLEIEDFRNKIESAAQFALAQKNLLKEKQEVYGEVSKAINDIVSKIGMDRTELDLIKNKLYELQMQNKDIDFKYLSLKDRILQSYKADLENFNLEQEGYDENILTQDIQRLKEKLDSYGTVNLVAIEEYDELKKRYDFLAQQQGDLISAKDSLHEALLKINRVTRKMFLETFEKVSQEFRNYFRFLFGGGDAQIFLVDEQDPLESGIEIICRPPGKKLQNVLLLSGGEKSLSATALIFAIFKVKPSPFCVLDEIDAALDEANVDRFSRILLEFAKTSQFIVITHNKKTIENADVMYGITMEESGISKIVSVKFAQGTPLRDKEQDIAVSEPV